MDFRSFWAVLKRCPHKQLFSGAIKATSGLSSPVLKIGLSGLFPCLWVSGDSVLCFLRLNWILRKGNKTIDYEKTFKAVLENKKIKSGTQFVYNNNFF